MLGVCAVPGTGGPGGRTWIASAGDDGAVRVWEPVTGRLVGGPLTGHTGPVLGVCAVPGTGGPGGRTWIASAGTDGTVRVWDPVTGRLVGGPLTGHAGPVLGVCAVPGTGGPGGRTWIASAGDDGAVRVWDPVTSRPVGEPLTTSQAPVAALQPLRITDAACAVVRSAGYLHLWKPATGTLTPAATPTPHVSAFAELTTKTNSPRVWIVADPSGLLTLITPTRGAPSRTTRLGDTILSLLSIPGQPPQLACASRNGTIALLHADTLRPAGPPLTGHDGPVRTLCLLTTPNSPAILASAGHDAAIRLWDPSGRTAIGGPLTGHDGWIWALTAIPATSPDTTLLASAGADATIRIWDPRTGEAAMPPLTGHTGQVRALTLAVAADGSTLLLSGGHDGTIRLWHPVTGQAIHAIPLGVPVHALLQQPLDHRSRQRTANGATIVVGLRTGILSLDLNRSMFPVR